MLGQGPMMMMMIGVPWWWGRSRYMLCYPRFLHLIGWLGRMLLLGRFLGRRLCWSRGRGVGISLGNHQLPFIFMMLVEMREGFCKRVCILPISSTRPVNILDRYWFWMLPVWRMWWWEGFVCFPDDGRCCDLVLCIKDILLGWRSWAYRWWYRRKNEREAADPEICGVTCVFESVWRMLENWRRQTLNCGVPDINEWIFRKT